MRPCPRTAGQSLAPAGSIAPYPDHNSSPFKRISGPAGTGPAAGQAIDPNAVAAGSGRRIGPPDRAAGSGRRIGPAGAAEPARRAGRAVRRRAPGTLGPRPYGPAHPAVGCYGPSRTPGHSMPDPASARALPTLAFIGGGNMARSLVGGLLAAGADPAAVRVADPSADARTALASDFGVATFESAADAVDGAEAWVFAVKPQVMRAVCTELAAVAQQARPLVVSIAAGITSAQLDRWLGGGLAV